MPTNSTSPQATSMLEPSALLDPILWLSHHPRISIAIGAFCLWISISLTIRMWFIHRNARFLKKLFWSVVLLVPLFGWLFYAGLFHALGYNEDQGTTEHFGAMGGGTGV